MIKIDSNKVCVRTIKDSKVRVMYMSAGECELIIDSSSTICYISQALVNVVRENAAVKFYNSIAPVILEVTTKGIAARFQATTLDILLQIKISASDVTPEYFKSQTDDGEELYEKSKIYNKVYSESVRRLAELERTSKKKSPIDTSVYRLLKTLETLTGFALGEVPGDDVPGDDAIYFIQNGDPATVKTAQNMILEAQRELTSAEI